MKLVVDWLKLILCRYMFKVIEYVLLFVCKEVIFLNIKLMKCMCSYVYVNVWGVWI